MRGKTQKTERSSAPAKPSFSGHETFVFRHSWLKKAVDAVMDDPEVFTRENAIVTLGVGKNMVRSIRHWGLATGVLAEGKKGRGSALSVSDFGRVVMGRSGLDPFLEDPSTLWLLHWNILNQESRCTTWHYVFNRFPAVEFTKPALTQFVLEEARTQGAAGAESSIRRDVDVFLRTYVGSADVAASSGEDSLDCPLSEIQLIEPRHGHDLYQLQRSPKQSLGEFAFLYTLCQFWNSVSSNQQTLAFNEIAYRAGSPGSVFRLDENSLADRLERLDVLTEGNWVYTETAGLRQVYKHSEIDPDEMLQEHYRHLGEFRDLEVMA